LYEPPFWGTVAAALIVLVPLRLPVLRRWSLAAINFGLLALLLNGVQLVAVAAAVLAAYLLLKLVERGRGSLLAVGLGIAGVLALFVLHKLPRLAADLGLEDLAGVLRIVGFSYVTLRFIDVSLAVWESRQAPGLPATVNYLLPFHMLAAGPIQAYNEFVDQPSIGPKLSISGALTACERIAAGLFKKYVLAVSINDLFLTGFRGRGWYFLLEVQLHYLWLYLDFSAYSDIAVGVGCLLGVATPENFNKPYLARNMIDYWERWHISLSMFIRRHLFIPVQLWLVRRSDGRWPLRSASLAFLVSFGLCGLWHELSLRWLLWGLIQALGLSACTAYRHALVRRLGRQGVKAYLANPWIRVLAIVFTFEFVAFSLVVVRFPYEGYLR
jgi:D-alanyl-lipoteichoic acid acyltransferase DltB (MBOAT superfamily)